MAERAPDCRRYKKQTLEMGEGRLTDRCGTARMMRQMAQQLRSLIDQRLTPITPRLLELVNQLEQEADVETVIAAASTASRTMNTRGPTRSW
jgi:hypothetical protein